MANIKVRLNGPYLVEGDDVTLVDWNGNAYQIPKRPFALCRCGGSPSKPFCDGTHAKIGFAAAEAAVRCQRSSAAQLSLHTWSCCKSMQSVPRFSRLLQVYSRMWSAGYTSSRA